jgi:hypothetical protein
MMRLPAAAALATAAGLVFVVGCSGSANESSQPALSADEVAERYGYDRDSAELTPSFALVSQYKDPRDGYARDLVAHDCMKGVADYHVVSLTPPEGAVFDVRTAQTRFDVDVASKYGYKALYLAPRISTTVIDGEITPAIGAKLRECGRVNDERLGAPPEKGINSIESAGWNAAPDAPRVQAAAEEWVACMSDVGVVDLPADPRKMPTESVVGATDPSNPLAQYVPSAREIEVAVADAECRESSGYTKAFFDAQVDAELTAIGADVESFEAVRAEYVDYGQRVDEVIAEFGG